MPIYYIGPVLSVVKYFVKKSQYFERHVLENMLLTLLFLALTKKLPKLLSAEKRANFSRLLLYYKTLNPSKYYYLKGYIFYIKYTHLAVTKLPVLC